MAEQTATSTVIDVEQEALEMRSMLAAIAITDQVSYDRAVDARIGAKGWIKGAEEFFDGLVKPAYVAYKNLLDTKKKVIGPVENTVAAINLELLKWDKEQEQIRRAEQQRLENEALAEAERQREEDAKHLAATGADEETVAAVLSEPVQVTAPVVAARTYEASKAVQYRDHWQAEVTDLHALVKFVAKNKGHIALLQPNPSALNNLAKALKQTLGIPGIKAVNKRLVASGRV